MTYNYDVNQVESRFRDIAGKGAGRIISLLWRFSDSFVKDCYRSFVKNDFTNILEEARKIDDKRCNLRELIEVKMIDICLQNKTLHDALCKGDEDAFDFLYYVTDATMEDLGEKISRYIENKLGFCEGGLEVTKVNIEDDINFENKTGLLNDVFEFGLNITKNDLLLFKGIGDWEIKLYSRGYDEDLSKLILQHESKDFSIKMYKPYEYEEHIQYCYYPYDYGETLGGYLCLIKDFKSAKPRKTKKQE